METLALFEKQFPTDEACKAYLQAKRWPDGVRCPRCKRKDRIYTLKARPFHWACCNKGCGERRGYRFSVITKTIFQDTKVPLTLWFKIGYLMLTAKKGISSLQVRRTIFGEDSGTDWRTCWYICHRWRAAMKGDAFPLTGVVEVDETGIGGKDKNRHWNKKQHVTGLSGKATVIGAIARKGNVVCQVIENTDTPTLDRFVRKVVNKEKVELVATDEALGYARLATGPDALPHKVIRHGSGEYVRGVVHTNNIENFWSLLKRGIVGSFHHVSKDYLPLYLNEFSYRHNNRKNADIFGDLITTCSQ